ncbi:hypothetical protein CXT76_00275 [Candidatus Parvarchaeota archaeon]|jgi:hypothetical protein|nr:MAG: hypothetical protein CXT76_00275 [Candidatus Parvarchaeota archaeon]HIG52358.1 hypothetical protein [Candidatus Pacearchaeota archaeon]
MILDKQINLKEITPSDYFELCKNWEFKRKLGSGNYSPVEIDRLSRNKRYFSFLNEISFSTKDSFQNSLLDLEQVICVHKFFQNPIKESRKRLEDTKDKYGELRRIIKEFEKEDTLLVEFKPVEFSFSNNHRVNRKNYFKNKKMDNLIFYNSDPEIHLVQANIHKKNFKKYDLYPLPEKFEEIFSITLISPNYEIQNDQVRT